MENSDRYIPTETIQLTIVDQLRSLIDRGTPGSSIYLRALGAIETLRRERDEARDVLSGIAFYLSVGSGDDSTTAEQYNQRIRMGIDYLTKPLDARRENAEADRDAALALLREAGEALEPFAAEEIGKSWSGTIETFFDCADLRRARTLLAKIKAVTS